MKRLKINKGKAPKLHEKQKKIVQSDARFKVIRAGRRAGKTTMAIEIITFEAVREGLQTRNIFYIAPTQDQARDIIWLPLKQRLHGVAKFQENLKKATLPNKSGGITTIHIGSWEKREKYRGISNVSLIVFDEVDTFKDFFLSWKEIFRPMLIDSQGKAIFIGTPKKENPNLKRLEVEFKDHEEWEFFHFTSKDNPYLSKDELKQIELDYIDNPDAYKQEILAEHVENKGALFNKEALIDATKQIVDSGDKYITVDISGDGQDKTLAGIWDGLNLVEIIELKDRAENLSFAIKHLAEQRGVPITNVIIDAIGVGSEIASSQFLLGSVAYKGSYSAIKTEIDPSKPDEFGQLKSLSTDYSNLRSQCIFTLAEHINQHKVSFKMIKDEYKEKIIEELSLIQNITTDGKLKATPKTHIKELLGRSPDTSDLLIMRMYPILLNKAIQVKTPQINQKNEKMLEFIQKRRRAFNNNRVI